MSTSQRFSMILSTTLPDLIHMISEKQGVSENDALTLLYSSKLYELLEQEETKIWHYSTETLYALFEDELKTGNIVFPDV